MEEQHIEVKVGEEFTLAESVSGGTGYLWEPRFDSSMVRQAGEARFLSAAPTEKKEAPGSARIQQLRFRALAPGDSQVVLELRRPFGKDKPRQTKSFHIRAH